MNNGPAKPQDGNTKVAVNSIQRTLFVERLWVNVAYPTDRIIPYDTDNLYPQKVKSIAERSGTTVSAIETLSSFISGEGFQGMNQIVNREGQNLWDILRHISFSKSMFKGFALHFNYNMLGQITEITPINFEFLRWSKDLTKYVYSPDWARRYSRRREEIEYNPFNPKKVFEEIKACKNGIDEYKGQILYWIPILKDYYTTCMWDSVLDDAQFEAETKLYSLSSVQNDYSLGGIVSYPSNLSGNEEIKAIKKDFKSDTGSKNAGGIRVVGALPNEEFKGWKWFTPISRNNIDGLHTNQIERAKFNIYAGFRQPPILNGVSKDGMFNQESFADAFHYYNSSTETERKEVEKQLTKILSFSIWPGIGEIQIQPKTFALRSEQTEQTTEQTEATEAKKVNETLTNLTGRQMQGVSRIVRKFTKGELNYKQAAIMLQDGFGFNEEQIEIWLTNEEAQ